MTGKKKERTYVSMDQRKIMAQEPTYIDHI
jgi:hypothetical protein